jgi:hypothetical protein
LCNLNSHGLATGDCIEFTNAGGALPAELTANTNYFVIYNDANSFKMATTLANAIAGTAINITDDGTGTHTLRHVPWGIDGANNFLLPDKQGVSEEGSGEQGTAAWASAYYTGGLGQYKRDQFQKHLHKAPGDVYYLISSPNLGGYSGGAFGTGTLTTSGYTADGGYGDPRTGYITAGPRVGVKKIIRYK